MPRPELQAPPEIYYNEVEARKYSTSSRIAEIQAKISERAYELLNLPNDGLRTNIQKELYMSACQTIDATYNRAARRLLSWRMMSGVRGLRMNHGLAAEVIRWSRRYSTIFISRLSSYTTEEGLRNTFSPFGSIKEVRLIKDHKTGRPKGFGFVEYNNEDGAQRAIKSMNYKIIDGRLIFVEVAKSSHDQS